jgi:glycosyltransferase involved in cell wall biosynthesis
MRYVVITPVRNEAEYIGETINSMVRQTILPQRWVIVDDGSSDGTGHIIQAAADRHPWITTVQRPDRGFRKSGGGVVEAFYDGYAALQGLSWEFIVKLDGDLTFEPNYFEACFARFEADGRVGVGGGRVLVQSDGQLQLDWPGPPFHVRGATKIYRRACWEQIAPLVQAPGWDTIDEVRANMHGWKTGTFSQLSLVQRRQTGSTESAWRSWYKNGRANYVTGYHPLFMLVKCLKRAVQGPAWAAPALCAGFCSGYFSRIDRVQDRRTIRYLRRQQLRRLFARPSIYSEAPDAQLRERTSA